MVDIYKRRPHRKNVTVCVANN